VRHAATIKRLAVAANDRPTALLRPTPSVELLDAFRRVPRPSNPVSILDERSGGGGSNRRLGRLWPPA
jgi:hypothetical protein